MKITHGVEMLDVAVTVMGSERVIHPTLLWENDNVILVDTGFPGQLASIRAAVAQTGVSFDNINRVILTHHDIDHIGGLSGIRSELPHALQVLAHVEEKAYIQGDKTPLKLAQMEANLDTLPEERKPFYAMLKSGFQSSFGPVDTALSDGQVLPYCGGITVIHTPGHTLGHICLYLPASKTLIAGDALIVENGALSTSSPAINYDMALCHQSLEKLSGYDIEAVICYHGGLYRGNVGQQIAALAQRI